jgi:hypothetical protein
LRQSRSKSEVWNDSNSNSRTNLRKVIGEIGVIFKKFKKVHEDCVKENRTILAKSSQENVRTEIEFYKKNYEDLKEELCILKQKLANHEQDKS